MIPLVDLAAQHRSLQHQLQPALERVLRSGQFILGPDVEAFEHDFASWLGAAHAIGVSSGIDALRLVLMALDIGPGDEVILPANTFIGTALAVSQVGARPVLVDCEPGTYNIDPSRLAETITPRTQAIIPVHLTGQCADMEPILELAAHHGLPVIEDAAQAHGARYKDQAAGTLGRAGCFSCYPGKNLGACGDAGVIVTSDPSLAERLRRLRHYGQQMKYHHTELGTNARLDSIQAAILRLKLPRLDGWNRARSRHAVQYRKELIGLGDLHFQEHSPDSTHVYHLFIIETDQRDALQQHLHQAGIQTAIHYPIPIHLQPAYRHLGFSAGAFPVAEGLAHRILSLPMYPELRPEQIQQVTDQIRGFFDHYHALPEIQAA